MGNNRCAALETSQIHTEIPRPQESDELARLRAECAVLREELGRARREEAVLRRALDEQERKICRLSKENEDLTVIFHTVPDLIWYKDGNNKILRANRAAAHASGVTPDGIEGHHTGEFFPADAAKYLDDDLEVIRTGVAKRNIIEQAEIGQNHDKHWVRTEKLPYRDVHGRIVGVVVLSTDIDELKSTQDRLRQLALELSRSNREFEQFAYVISHDLREPLRMISSFLTLLERKFGAALSGEAREYIAYAVDGANRLKGLVDGLLEYSRVDRRSNPPGLVSLENVVDRILGLREKNIQDLAAEVSRGALPQVTGDCEQLARLIECLLDNGLKFRRPDVPPRVRIACERKGEEWTVSVRDNGVGLDMQQVERAFLPFQKLDNGQGLSGQGLGLSLAKKIVERHGGRIWLDSTPQQGTTVFFTLPQIWERADPSLK